MNIERAIEILDPRHRETYESIDPINEACLMGMQALKKQVPAKPKITLHGTTGYNTKCSCPVCGSMVNSDNYCRNCGQAIVRNKEAATSSVNKHITGADTCVMCGEIIPEGTQVCPLCKQTVSQHKTNYNRIKAMSVEETARFINHNENAPCQCCDYKGNLCGDGTNTEICVAEISKWLNSEVEK